MKNLLAAILLATLAITAGAEPVTRQMRLVCGSLEDVQATMEKYGETLVMATQAPDKQSVNMVYVNFQTQTSSWFRYDLRADEYCMTGVGESIYIPDDSPLKQEIGLGTKVIYK